MPDKRNTPSFAVIGALAILAGLLPLMVAFDVVKVPADSIKEPRWVLAAAGGAFLIAGCMAMLQAHKRLVDLLAGFLLLLFAALGVWAAFLAPPESMSGGLFFLSTGANQKLGRAMFGFGALLTFLCAVYAFRLAVRGRR